MSYVSNFARSEGDPKVLRSGPSSLDIEDRLAHALGWFSIGLGFAELVAARRIAGALGAEGQENLIRLYGAREIGSGIMTLSTEKHVGLWSRVVGDVLDILWLAPRLRSDNPQRGNAGVALAAVSGVALLDVLGAQLVTARGRRPAAGTRHYRDRSGFPQGLATARGAAKAARGRTDAPAGARWPGPKADASPDALTPAATTSLT